MIYKEQNILKVESGIICQQVNCMGVMGAGLALQLKQKFPQIFREYIEAYKDGKLTLGTVVLTIIDAGKPLFVANMCAQYLYGRRGCYTNYSAFEECLRHVVKFRNFRQAYLDELDTPIYIPYKIGCGLAGGDWSEISKLIEKVIPDAIICKWR